MQTACRAYAEYDDEDDDDGSGDDLTQGIKTPHESEKAAAAADDLEWTDASEARMAEILQQMCRQ